MLTREEQIEEIRKSTNKHLQEKLVFEPQVWEPLKEARNCFTYALNIKTGIIEKSLVGDVVALTGINHPSTVFFLDEIYKLWLEALRVCKISFNESYFDEAVPYGWYKVAMYISSEDIHWLRQDDDGSWSHKQGWFKMPVNLDEDGMPITDPSKAKINVSGEVLDIKYLLIFRNIPE